jgi:hypothetical protein
MGPELDFPEACFIPKCPSFYIGLAVLANAGPILQCRGTGELQIVVANEQ